MNVALQLVPNDKDSVAKLPPMLQQYLEYKQKYPDNLIFFQVGDFYELFFNDAVTVSKTLNLTLTSRDKNSAEPVPMCGVPIAVVDGYLDRLVAAGFSVAIISQGAVPEKGMVPRFLERIVTPGIRILGKSEEARNETLVAAIVGESEREFAVAFSSVQSGVISVRDNITVNDLPHEISKISPIEIILPATFDNKAIDRRLGWVRRIEQILGERRLKFRSLSSLEASGGSRDVLKIEGFAQLSLLGKRSVRLLCDYVDETVVSAEIPLRKIERFSYEGLVTIDAPTRKNLELTENSRGAGRIGTLFEYLDLTCSVAGARTLSRWVVQPLTDLRKIQERHDAVAALVDDNAARVELAKLLDAIIDFERVAARIELKVIAPKELASLRDSLERLPNIIKILESKSLKSAGSLKNIKSGLKVPSELVAKLKAGLADNPPFVMNEGGILKDGYNAEVDRLREVRSGGNKWLAELEAREKESTGIQSLKVRFNNIMGFFIEVTKANLSKVPEYYQRRQSTTNSDRFTTPELKKLESEVLSAESKLFALERKIYEEIRTEIVKWSIDLRVIGKELAELDILRSFSELAIRDDLVRPEMSNGTELEIKEGKHPVLSKILAENFIPNSLYLASDGARSVIITGPNMGGKSTFLRQAALVTIMAQIGAYVPAKSAKIGIVDQIFARLGASDNLSEGESTFMVEMREASHIVAHATKRSLVLIDEIGRGTATMDGLAIAQAVLEWLVVKAECRLLFATHFHELTGLDQIYPALQNLSVGSVKRGEDVIFTHEIGFGAANHSYGLEVAKLAGLPQHLISRAKELLLQAEKEKEIGVANSPRQLTIFSAPPQPVEPQDYSALKQLKEKIIAKDVNSITPLEAINILAQLKQDLL